MQRNEGTNAGYGMLITLQVWLLGRKLKLVRNTGYKTARAVGVTVEGLLIGQSTTAGCALYWYLYLCQHISKQELCQRQLV